MRRLAAPALISSCGRSAEVGREVVVVVMPDLVPAPAASEPPTGGKPPRGARVGADEGVKRATVRSGAPSAAALESRPRARGSVLAPPAALRAVLDETAVQLAV